ncbi:MAG: hypothetical protein QXX17_01315 [Conexivisphaerales archaeon]
MSVPEETNKLRPVLIDLIDAVRYAQSFFETDEKEKAARDRAEKRLQELELLVSSITDSLTRLRWLDEATKQELSRNIQNFVNAAVDQVKGKVESSLKADIIEFRNAAEREKLKSLKSIEAFLAASPLPVLDKVITMKHDQSSYSSKVKYKAEGDIQYDFDLNSADSNLFKQAFTFSSRGLKLKLPVRLAKTWLKKEPEPVFERFDEYILERAEVSKNQLVASFVQPETQASVDVVFSKANSDSFITIEYNDAKGRVDVTGQPSLSKHLDLNSYKSAFSQLLESILNLEESKLALSRLKMDDEDVLEKLDMYGFMLRVLKVIGPELQKSKDVMQVDNSLVRERLKLLGDRAKPLIKALGIPEKMLTETEWTDDK